MFCQPTPSQTYTQSGLEWTRCSKCGEEYLSFRKRACPKAR